MMCVGGGAILNVAVAWGCAIWSHPDWTVLNYLSDHDMQLLWSKYAPADWPISPTEASRQQSFGVVIDSAMHQELVEDTPPQKEFVQYVRSGGLDVREWHATEYRFGWPIISWELAMLAHSDYRTNDNTLVGGLRLDRGVPWLGINAGQVLPIGPLWLGFLVNTIFYSAFVWMLMRGPWETRRRWRELHCKCGVCGYPRGSSPVCTECGGDLSRAWGSKRNALVVAKTPGRAGG